jgi:hypothetical protein
MKAMKDFWSLLRHRWQNAMPRFFARICWICALISGTALAVNTAINAGGGTTHEWWNDLYPYLLGIPAGMAFVAKFTQNYDKSGNPIRKGLEATAPSAVNNSDIVATAPDDFPSGDDTAENDIEPYNEHLD